MVGAFESCNTRLGWLIVLCQQRMLSSAVCHASALKQRARGNLSSQPGVRVDAECGASAVWLAAIAVHTHLCTLAYYRIPALYSEQRISACCLDARINGREEKGPACAPVARRAPRTCALRRTRRPPPRSRAGGWRSACRTWRPTWPVRAPALAQSLWHQAHKARQHAVR